MSDQLPPARMIPKDGADRAAILRGQARDGAKVAGRVAVGAGKTLGILAICGVGIFAIGAGTGRHRSRSLDDLDRRMESLRRASESLRAIQNMPRIDFSKIQFDRPSFQRQLDLSPGGHEHEPRSTLPTW